MLQLLDLCGPLVAESYPHNNIPNSQLMIFILKDMLDVVSINVWTQNNFVILICLTLNTVHCFYKGINV